MILKCDTCGQTKEVENPLCVTCNENDEDDGYCYFYETRFSAMEKDPNTYHCYGYTNLCECEGLMEQFFSEPSIVQSLIEKTTEEMSEEFKESINTQRGLFKRFQRRIKNIWRKKDDTQQ